MTGSAVNPFQPLVSVVLTTRDRPRFLPLALAGYQQQTYPHRELIVVDDGEQFPVSGAEVAAAGGRLLRVAPGTPLGSKLNTGIAAARGRLIQKMDDDDWYGPGFLAAMVAALAERWHVACRPTLAFLSPFLFFDLARWESGARSPGICRGRHSSSRATSGRSSRSVPCPATRTPGSCSITPGWGRRR